jgi:hypothetical protein
MHDDLHAGAIVIEAGGREAALVGTTTGRSQGTPSALGASASEAKRASPARLRARSKTSVIYDQTGLGAQGKLEDPRRSWKNAGWVRSASSHDSEGLE